jgi:hypothetical protein
MNKKIKVIELLNLLAENKIEKATKIKYGRTIYIVDFPNLCGIYPEGGTTKVSESLFSNINILSLNNEVEILEDEEIKIDIQSIKAVTSMEVGNECSDKTMKAFLKIQRALLELTLAVKQLDKEINKED